MVQCVPLGFRRLLCNSVPWCGVLVLQSFTLCWPGWSSCCGGPAGHGWWVLLGPPPGETVHVSPLLGEVMRPWPPLRWLLMDGHMTGGASLVTVSAGVSGFFSLPVPS